MEIRTEIRCLPYTRARLKLCANAARAHRVVDRHADSQLRPRLVEEFEAPKGKLSLSCKYGIVSSVNDWESMQKRASEAAASVARYCDRAEHCEEVDRGWIVHSGELLRTVAVEAALHLELELRRIYAERLRHVENRSPIPAQFDGHSEALRATTWHDFQVVQFTHDVYFHPDVHGMSRLDQLRHYSFHLGKIANNFVELDSATEASTEFRERRLPDTFLFGIKLATLVSQKLPDTPITSQHPS